jgi:hypothetical protein
MVCNDRPVYQEEHAAQLIMARRDCSPLKGRIHLRRPVDRHFAFPLQSCGGPYISANFAVSEEKSKIITSVSIPTVSNQSMLNDSSYEEDWRLYYAQRQNIMRRFAECAAGATISALIFVIVPVSTQERHPITMNVLGAIGAFFLLATAFQWFRFMWTLGGWICPRCREPFFHSTLVRNPFGRHCRHCNLRRLKSSEIVHGLHS